VWQSSPCRRARAARERQGPQARGQCSEEVRIERTSAQEVCQHVGGSAIRRPEHYEARRRNASYVVGGSSEPADSRACSSGVSVNRSASAP
jgi:hypothetical protein